MASAVRLHASRLERIAAGRDGTTTQSCPARAASSRIRFHASGSKDGGMCVAAAFSPTALQIAKSVTRVLPHVQIEFAPDLARQAILDS